MNRLGWTVTTITAAVVVLSTLGALAFRATTLGGPDPMSLATALVPLGVPVLVVWGLLLGKLWDRALRGRNVALPKPKVPKDRDPYRTPAKIVKASPWTTLAMCFAMLVGSQGCVTGYRATYGAGAITKELVTQSHNVYSTELNERFDDCDPRVNPESEVTTWEEFEECMGDGYTEERAELVNKLLAAYRAAAATLSAVLLQADPSKEELDKAWKAAFTAAVDFLKVLPGGAEQVEKLRTLLGRMAG